MKFVVFALFVVIGSVFADSNELTVSEERFLQAMMNDYRGSAKEYVRSSMSDVAEAVCENKDTDLSPSLEEVIKRAEEVDADALTVCSLIKNHLVYVVDPMAQAVDACLPNEEAGIAQYGIRAIVSAVSYLCDLNGEHILELINPCVEDVDFDKNKCMENVADKWNEVTTTDKTFKEVACSEYADVRPCLDDALAEACKLQLTKDSIMGLIDAAFQTPCEA